ncbi:sporulation protein [Novosphingobium sp. Leaf2]|nr:sporulation protein [Novosphingobium sp. Leaf2]
MHKGLSARAVLAVVAAACLTLSTAPAIAQAPAAGDVKSGVDAWSAGNYDAAVRIWQPLADKGDPDAQFNLAQAYKMGRGVPLDLARAEALYGRAAAKGHTQAADAYGLLLFQRGERQKALPYIEAAASRGDPRAQYIMGVAHFNGDIATKDWVRAYALTSLARQAGLPQATSALQQMDQHIPLPDREKSVVLAEQIAAQTQANRQRLNASAELGTQLALAEPAPARQPTPDRKPAVIASARPAVTVHPAQSSTERPERERRPPAPPATPAPKPAPSAKPAPRPTPVAASGPWRVQLGAFGVPGNAEALWARIKGRSELSGRTRVLAPAGKLTKLQATGFASSADAQSACARLRAGGFTCLATRD